MQRPDIPKNLETLQLARRFVPMLAPEWAGFPITLTSLIGREQEITDVSALLQNSQQRLVSLLGPGGVGKTRLAIAVAENVRPAFPDGTAFVSLAPLSHSGEVPAAVAAILGAISTADRTTTQSIVLALQERRFLLILDNLEHLQSQAVNEFVLALLQQCPYLSLLITSREPLRLTGEQRYLTPALCTIAKDQRLHAVADLPAVQLFVARASAARQDFAIKPGDASVVAEICHRLDGLPLAIELAAAWMRVLSPEALLTRLAERLSLLTGNNADQPARFQTMRAAISWSYDLLTPEEARILRRLSVFRGTFTLEAAARVALSTDELPAAADLTILNLVATLCDKSLLAPADPIGPVQRFTMLETVREFAYEKLVTAGDLDRTSALHAEYFRNWLESIEPEFFGPREGHLMELCSAELGNIHLALHWGVLNDADLAQRICSALWAYWGFHNPGEGLRWLSVALSARGGTSSVVRSRALRTAGAMAVLIGNYDEAVVLANEALELAIQANAPWLEGEARWVLAICETIAGQLDEAMQNLTRALALTDAARTPTEITTAAYTRSHLGVVAFLLGNRAWGIELYDQAVAELRNAGSAGVSMIVLTDYAGWLTELERLAPARQLLHEAILLARRAPTSWPIAGCLICLALVDALEGHASAAVHKLGAVEGIRRGRGVAVPIQFQQRVARATDLAKAALNPFAFGEAFEHGRVSCVEIVDQLLSDSELPAMDEVHLQAARRLGISRRESEVLPYLVAGLSDREIATRMFISHRTASSHVGKIMQRLGASSRADAAVRAVRLGLV